VWTIKSNLIEIRLVFSDMKRVDRQTERRTETDTAILQ